jgi:hypothetical protein
MPKTKSARDIPLVSFEVFRKNAKNILNQSKNESDRKLESFQIDNVKKREARKKGVRK